MQRTLLVAFVGVVVVFIVLVLIILCIRLYSGIITRGGKRRDETNDETLAEPLQSLSLSDYSVSNVTVVDNTEIIAVISAAVMACMQGSSTGLRVRSIRRIGHTTPIWNVAGRNEQTMSGI